MKKAVVFFVLFALALSGCGGGQKATPPGTAASPAPLETVGKAALSDGPAQAGETAYVGAINGDIGIHMRLKIENGKATGSYYYDSVKTDIVLRGEVDGPQIRITEYDAAGKSTGRFYGMFVAPDRIEGVWAVYNPARDGQFRDLWVKIHPFYVVKEGLGREGAGPDLTVYKEAWEGTWRRPVSTSSTFGEVRISFATDKSFWFEMFQFSGANSRQLRGIALLEGDEAVFRNGRGDELRFTRNDGKLLVKTSDNFSYTGAGVVFDGEFTRGETRRRTLAEIGVLESAAQEEVFKKMTGRYYDGFINHFHMGGRVESLDGPETKAYFGYIRGIAPHNQGFIVRSDEGAIWAALLTFVDRQSAIVYFASDGKVDGPIPKTIEKWIADVQKDRERKLEVIRYR